MHLTRMTRSITAVRKFHNSTRWLADTVSHCLLRVPLAVMFITQGLSKLPYDPAVGQAMGVAPLVWFVVAYGELSAGVGLLIGGVAMFPRVRDWPMTAELGDMLTRFCGITMCCIVTGVIWTVLKPTNLWQFVLTDYLHVSLWVGGLYFALRGNWEVVKKGIHSR